MAAVAPDDFDWDDGNREKCQQHGLTIADIERILANAETLIVPDEKNSKVEPRFLAIGRTATARYAVVIFTPRRRENETVLRPISARYMHRKEIDKYAQEISRTQN
jgi:uncharacterized DUF497 family protein